MRDFSITGIPTKDYYDFHGETREPHHVWEYSYLCFGGTG